MKNNFKDYICHHGVEGQRWGVRNGPPYPIEDKVLRKGTKLEHISKHYAGGNNKALLDFYQRSKRALYVYRQDEEHDTKVYRGPFAKFLYMYTTGQQGRLPEVHDFEVKEDMIMPTKKERVDAFIEVLKKSNKKEIAELEYIRDACKQQGIKPTGASNDIYDVDFKNIKTEKDMKKAYFFFNHTMEAAHRYGITKRYVEYMCKRWDAMVDDNNVNIYNMAHDPIIIMNTKKLLASPGVAKQLTISEIINNTEELRKTLEKHGERIKL